MTDYLNGKPTVEILGSPKTVRLQGAYRGEAFEAPMEVWIMALVAVLTPAQKQTFFEKLRHVEETADYARIQRAQVVADIPMPPLEG